MRKQRTGRHRAGGRSQNLPRTPRERSQKLLYHKQKLAHRNHVAQKWGYGNAVQKFENGSMGIPYELSGTPQMSEQNLDYNNFIEEYPEYQDTDLEFLDLTDMDASDISAAETEIPEDEPVVLSPDKVKRKKRTFALAACLVVLLMLIGFVYYQLPSRCVKESVTIEAGEACPSVTDFLEWECKNAYIVSGISEDMEFQHVQDYEVVIHLYHQDITTTLHVVDTVAPKIQTKNKTIIFGDSYEVTDFVESVSDITTYAIFYLEEPDIQGGGIYTIELVVKDEGDNIAIAAAQLEVIQDVTPPVIEGVEEITITVGETVSYKRNITVMDDYDDNVKLEVDNSEVDTDTPGNYTIIYRATDKYGNTAEVSTILHVREVNAESGSAENPAVTEATVNAAADEILASITDPSMSKYEVIKAIYDWCHSKIAYVDGTSKASWVDGAYAGLILRKGDCYAYAMTAKCLLTRAGITNMDIERVPVGNSMHFWNLVDIGEGWHHFDTCRRADGSTFFYLTDAELMAYSEKHTASGYPNGTHYYDRSLYPEIP